MAEATQPIPSQSEALLDQLAQSPMLKEALRFLIALGLALGVFSIILLIQGKAPVQTYRDLYQSTLGSEYGRSEVGVKMIPLMLCALAVAVPARIGLVNVGGEGQLYMGALLAKSGLRLPSRGCRRSQC